MLNEVVGKRTPEKPAADAAPAAEEPANDAPAEATPETPEMPPPPPETPDNFTSSPEVGARMSQFAAPPRRARVRMRVITPKPGRTLKHLYAAAVGAPLLKPDWITASLDAGRALSPASTPPGVLLSKRHAAIASDDDDDDDDDDYDDDYIYTHPLDPYDGSDADETCVFSDDDELLSTVLPPPTSHTPDGDTQPRQQQQQQQQLPPLITSLTLSSLPPHLLFLESLSFGRSRVNVLPALRRATAFLRGMPGTGQNPWPREGDGGNVGGVVEREWREYFMDIEPPRTAPVGKRKGKGKEGAMRTVEIDGDDDEYSFVVCHFW